MNIFVEDLQCSNGQVVKTHLFQQWNIPMHFGREIWLFCV